MAIFVAVTLGPCSLFFMYVLYQFWREAMQTRPQKVLRFRATPTLARLEPIDCEQGIEARTLKRHEVLVFASVKKQEVQVTAPDAKVISRGSF